MVPDLYVFHATSPGHYEPVWHAASDDPHRPLIADLDGDGRQELAFNGIDGVEVIESLGGNDFLLSVPRYEPFTAAARTASAST